MKQSEVSDSITIRTPRGDGLLKALKAIAKRDSRAKGYAVTVTALGRIALKAYVRERLGPNVKYYGSCYVSEILVYICQVKQQQHHAP